MTQAEFNAAQRNARENYRKIMQKMNREISKLYNRAAHEISEKIKALQLKGKGQGPTAAAYKKLESSLKRIGARIAGQTEEIIIDGINQGITDTNLPHLKYLKAAINKSKTTKIQFGIVEDMYAHINELMIDLTYARVWSSGYTFSTSIWGTLSKYPGLAQYWTKNVKDLIVMGFMQGRDVLQIAKDLRIYSEQGKIKLMKRYGELVRGTKSFSKRIPSHIDWRALRIARSELYISLQDAAKIQGKYNPAVLAYIWHLTGGTGVHECVCPDIEADSPYLEGEVPDFPHPNCLCYITHKIKGRKEFVDDLVSWDGSGIPYLDDWYQDFYLPAG